MRIPFCCSIRCDDVEFEFGLECDCECEFVTEFGLYSVLVFDYAIHFIFGCGSDSGFIFWFCF